MRHPIEDDTHPDEADWTPEETKQGNPGRPQSDFEGGGPHHPEQTAEELDPTDPLK